MSQYNQVLQHVEIVNILTYIISIAFIVFIGVGFKKKKPSLKQMIVIAIFAAMAFVLSFIKFIAYPQGGGINLLPFLPIMLVSIFYGITEGMTCGLIYGVLLLITGGHIVGIAEALMDYVLASVTLGLAGIVGREKRSQILIGSIIAVFLSVLANIISGVYFYGMYAPPGMNLWWYSITYNVSSAGVVGVLSIIVIMLLPIKRLKKHVY
ncbi:energy-coupled thiamine transporter ThiT [uncultured Clostridium sp.]|jgi:thiamine transporter|uniref:energy-coupled thiamine transporter ThiT n=1 Tax=uncultured Clostridium sp. TaxID=59620 RepID=UPI002602D760|nr:energy-coupled thiamine transporter ThiT [uncultured Clostridium sp.]